MDERDTAILMIGDHTGQAVNEIARRLANVPTGLLVIVAAHVESECSLSWRNTAPPELICPPSVFPQYREKPEPKQPFYSKFIKKRKR